MRVVTTGLLILSAIFLSACAATGSTPSTGSSATSDSISPTSIMESDPECD